MKRELRSIMARISVSWASGSWAAGFMRSGEVLCSAKLMQKRYLSALFSILF
jgi:hypothetical protein